MKKVGITGVQSDPKSGRQQSLSAPSQNLKWKRPRSLQSRLHRRRKRREAESSTTEMQAVSIEKFEEGYLLQMR